MMSSRTVNFFAVTWRFFALHVILFSSLLGALGQPYGLASRTPVGAFLNNAVPPAAPGGATGGWTTTPAFPGLTFDDPVFLTFEPRTNRLYVCERQGKIWHFANNPATSNKVLFLDLTPQTQGWDDCGVLGIAFHPEFNVAGSTNRDFVYVYYQYSPSPSAGPSRPPQGTPGYNRLSRFTVNRANGTAGNESVLIHQFDEGVWHNGGGIFFGPDGFLYLSNGDEGAANDSYNNTQKINLGLFSGVLRIDVNRDPLKSHPIRRQPQNGGALPSGSGWVNSYTTNYFIPNDNPFVNPNGSVLEEFWALGLRSPHRMTLDPLTGQIWLGDVGQGTWEEIDIIEKGGNYQWVYMEGFHAVSGKTKPTGANYFGIEKPPIYEYAHANNNNCVIGGYVYRGSLHAADLGGKYLFGDNGSGRIWTMTYDGTNPPVVTLLCNMPSGANYSGLSSFGVDANNELYMCKMGRPSAIYKLARTGSPVPEPPARLSQTGVFTNLASLATAASIIPYDVNSPLWSDAAVKRRWLAVPNDGAPYGAGETIGFAPTGEWTFPNGTVFIKHFELPVSDVNPALRKRLETRLLVRDTNGSVYGVTYKWRADGTDADLLTNSVSEAVSIATATGTRTQTWYYPSRQDCLTCHNGNAKHVLGVKTRQLNGNTHYDSSGITDNQLRTWNHIGLFNQTLNEASIPGWDKLVAVTNSSASFEHRVRSYLDANCALCHRPNGVQAYFDARYDTPLVAQGIVNGVLGNDLGIAGARVIAPGSVPQSVMHLRLGALGANQMPPLAKNKVDDAAVATLAAWINSLPVPGPVPPPWTNSDVGNPSLAGDATHAGGAFAMEGAGTDIGGTSDQFHFVHQPWSGGGEIIARVTGLENTDPAAKAGVMFRESLAAGSRHVLMTLTRSNGLALLRRTTTGGSGTSVATVAGAAAPWWIRLVRSNDVFFGYGSTDGINWTPAGVTTNTWPAGSLVGLAVSSRNPAALNHASFDNVVVNGPPNTPPVIALVQPFANDAFEESTPITLAANASDPDGSIDRVEFRDDTTPIGQDSTAPFTFAWSGVTPGYHTLRAVAYDNRGSASTSAPVRILVNRSTAGSTNLLVTANSLWSYRDDGSDQGIAWRGRNFDDTSWPTGPAELGFGDGDEATVVNGGPSTNRFITFYFRRAFPGIDPATVSNLLVRLRRDDGAVVYLNDSEIFRSNMPTGAIAFMTRASATASDQGNAFFQTNVNPALLRADTNVIAVEVHQANNTSSDISFDAELVAIRGPATPSLPPTIALVAPTNNASYDALASVALQASVVSNGWSIARVEFFANAFLLGEDTAPPYTLSWNDAPAGTYALTARLLYGVGANNSVTSAPVTVSVVPLVANPDSYSAIEDLGLLVPIGDLFQNDTGLGTLSAALVDPPTNGIVELSVEGGFLYTPAGNRHGVDHFTYKLSNGSAESAPATVTILIAPVNDPPTALTPILVFAEDTSRPIVLEGSDVENSPLTYSVLSNPAHGTLTGVPPSLRYTPDTNYHGSDSFTFKVSDGQLESAITTAFLTITPVNDRPVIAAISNQTIDEDGALNPVSFTVADVETAAAALDVSAHSSNTELLPEAGLIVTGTGTARAVAGATATNQFGNVTITLIVTDADGGSATNAFTLTVRSVNDAPTLNALENLHLDEGAGQQSVALAGITSGAANELQVLNITASSSDPTIVPNPEIDYTSPALTGLLRLQPIPGTNGEATITVTVTDNGGFAQGGTNRLSRTFLVQVEPLPRLQVRVVDAKLLISWPATATGYQLEGRPDFLPASPWEVVNLMPVLNGTEQTVTLDPAGPQRCFRLRKNPSE